MVTGCLDARIAKEAQVSFRKGNRFASSVRMLGPAVPAGPVQTFAGTWGSQKGVSQGVSQQFLTVWTPCLFGEFVSPLSSLSSRRTCPAEICFPPFRLSKPSGQNYLRLDAWQWVCRERQGGFAGQRFSLAGERICGGSLITFCSAALTTKSEFWSSGITIESIF